MTWAPIHFISSDQESSCLFVNQTLAYGQKLGCPPETASKLALGKMGKPRRYTEKVVSNVQYACTLSWSGGVDSEVSMLGDSPLVKLHNSRAAYEKFIIQIKMYP